MDQHYDQILSGAIDAITHSIKLLDGIDSRLDLNKTRLSEKQLHLPKNTFFMIIYMNSFMPCSFILFETAGHELVVNCIRVHRKVGRLFSKLSNSMF